MVVKGFSSLDSPFCICPGSLVVSDESISTLTAVALEALKDIVVPPFGTVEGLQCIYRTILKKKSVIKVAMHNSRSKIRAMKLVVSLPGVASVKVQESEQYEIVVTREGIEFAWLAMLIRKKVGCTELVSIAPVPEKKIG